jgi:chemotaxis protein methyltransferase CheR
MTMHQPIPQPSRSLAVLAALLESRTGQQIGTERAWRVETALKPVIRDRGFETLDQLVSEAACSPEVATIVVNALLNHESSFFRDAPVFDVVTEAARDMQAQVGTRRLRVWSAGCSMGQEPLSLAMCFAETYKDHPADLPEIIATDVSESALNRARSGRFTQFEIQRGLSVRRMIDWFDSTGTDWIAKHALVRNIQFRRMNLVADPLPGGRFDIVMCRNVLLYLSPKLRRQVLDRIAGAIRPGGLLVLGAGETVIGQCDRFRPSGKYRGLYTLDDGLGERSPSA